MIGKIRVRSVATLRAESARMQISYRVVSGVARSAFRAIERTTTRCRTKTVAPAIISASKIVMFMLPPFRHSAAAWPHSSMSVGQ